MIDPQDIRVPVVAGDPALAGPLDAVQPWPGRSAAAHAPGCACCAPLAQALSRLFLARVRAEIPFFTRVIVPCLPADEPALAAALAADPVTAARFRFAGRLQAGSSASSCAPSARCM
jgi:hypothetical protein